jgi:peroxiredoxin
VLLGAFVVAGWCGIYQLLTQNGRVLLRLEALESQLSSQGALPEQRALDSAGLPPGTVLNDFSLPILGGGTMTLSQWRGRELLLVFFSPDCGFCRHLLAELAMPAQPEAHSVPMPLFITKGDPEANRRLFEDYRISYPVLLQENSELASLYKVYGTPIGYAVDETGATASEALVGAERLLAALRSGASATVEPKAPFEEASRPRFTRSVATSSLVREGLKAGTRAPDFTLPRLDGAEVSLKDFQGRCILLVFSDPQCKPCEQLAQKLEQFHRQHRGIQILMVSRRDRALNERKAAELGLTFPIVLQRHWEISLAYGMFATPIGYVINEEGVLASDVAVGTDRILNLVSRSGVSRNSM